MSICKLDIKSLTLKYVLLKVYVSVLLVIPWFGWLVGFGFNGPLRQYFSLYRAVSQREGISWCWSYYIWKRFIYITNETILAFSVFIDFFRGTVQRNEHRRT